MSLYSDLSRLIRGQFRKSGIDCDPSMPLSRLTACYFEMNTRLIQPAPRGVHFSDQLHDATGQRKYLTRDERDAFLEAAGHASTRTTQLYNKLPEEISLDEIERIHL